jgi:hypothetical protein
VAPPEPAPIAAPAPVVPPRSYSVIQPQAPAATSRLAPIVNQTLVTSVQASSHQSWYSAPPPTDTRTVANSYRRNNSSINTSTVLETTSGSHAPTMTSVPPALPRRDPMAETGRNPYGGGATTQPSVSVAARPPLAYSTATVESNSSVAALPLVEPATRVRGLDDSGPPEISFAELQQLLQDSGPESNRGQRSYHVSLLQTGPTVYFNVEKTKKNVTATVEKRKDNKVRPVVQTLSLPLGFVYVSAPFLQTLWLVLCWHCSTSM